VGLKSFDVAIGSSPIIYFPQYTAISWYYAFFIKTYVCGDMVAFIVNGMKELANRSIALEWKISTVGL
jgi:hypothetical protein